MTRDLPAAVTQDLLGPQQSIVLVLVEIVHDELPSPLRYTSDIVSTTYNTNVYHSVPFQWVLPEVGDDGIAQATLEIANIDQTLIRTLRTLSSRGTCWIGYFVTSDMTTPFMEVSGLRVTGFSVSDPSRLQIILSGRQLGLERHCAVIMNGSQYPGLFK